MLWATTHRTVAIVQAWSNIAMRYQFATTTLSETMVARLNTMMRVLPALETFERLSCAIDMSLRLFSMLDVLV